MKSYGEYRDEIDMLRFACVMLSLAVALLFASMIVANSSKREVAHCYEDQVLVGVGQFEQGRYEAYICGPAADDYVVRR